MKLSFIRKNSYLLIEIVFHYLSKYTMKFLLLNYLMSQLMDGICTTFYSILTKKILEHLILILNRGNQLCQFN